MAHLTAFDGEGETGGFESTRTGVWLCYGPYAIEKTITDEGTPGAFQVTLYHQATRRLVDHTWSDSDGNYSFTSLNQDYFIVVGVDHRSPSPKLADANAHVVPA